MRPVATDRVGRLSVTTVVPAKKWLNQFRCHMGCKLGWAQATMHYMGPHTPMGRGTLERGWRQDLPIRRTIPSGPDVGISPDDVNQHSDWPTTKVVKCHIKFHHWKIHRCYVASHQISLNTCLFFCYLQQLKYTTKHTATILWPFQQF